MIRVSIGPGRLLFLSCMCFGHASSASVANDHGAACASDICLQQYFETARSLTCRHYEMKGYVRCSVFNTKYLWKNDRS